MLVIILTILNFLCLFALMTSIFKEDGVIKTSILAVTVFSFLYVIMSGLLFWIDAFTFVRALGVILIFTIPMTSLLIAKKKISVKQVLQYAQVPAVEIILIVLTFLLSLQNFELYSVGQDQGSYQVEAIELYMGNYEVEHDYEEYQILESEEDKASYLNMLGPDILGYYPLSNYYQEIGFAMSTPLSDVSGMYHGIQTFPAILALGGKLFGLENMMQVQTIFLICSVLLLYYALCNMKLPTSKILGALSIFLFSPLVLWISKTAFTEMILTLCISFYLFLLTEVNTRAKRLLLSLPLAAFSFIHVSFLLIYPVFILVNALLFFQNGQKEYIWDNVIISAGLSTGYFMMGHIAPQYFFGNLARLYYKNIITIENILYWVLLGCMLVSICPLLLLCIKDLNIVFLKIKHVCKINPILVLFFLGVILHHTVIIGYFRTPKDGWRESQCSYYGEGFFHAFSHSAFYAFVMATGFLVMMCVLWYMIRKHKAIWDTPIESAVYFLCLYCILFQSAFIRKEVNYYYYYSRYLVFYIPIICIAVAFFFRQVKRRGFWSILALSITAMAIFDVPLLLEKDQTLLEWETLQDLDDAIQDDSAIILEPDMAMLLGAPLRAVSDEAIFPVMSNIRSEIELLGKHYSNIYYLSSEFYSSESQVSDSSDIRSVDSEIAYRDRYLLQDTGVKKGHFPLRYLKERRQLVLYKIKTFLFDYPLNSTSQDFDAYGFSGVEETGRWTSENKADILCYLPSDNYQLSVDVNSVPLEQLGLDGYVAAVYINEIYLGDITLIPGNRSGLYQFDIPKEYIQNGYNTVSIHCERLWGSANAWHIC